jgi:hypothetical protein
LRLLGTIRHVAAARLSFWWQRALLRIWLDRVAYDAARMHSFPHRLITNFPPWTCHFKGGLSHISRILSTVSFTPRVETLPCCTACGRVVDAVCFFRDEVKMVNSSPHLYVGCRECLLRAPLATHSVSTVYTTYRDWISAPSSALLWIDPVDELIYDVPGRDRG